MPEILLAPAPWDDWQLFGEQVISGLATGSVYALVALAVVLIYRSTDVVNFAQGEMAMLCTFSMWSLTLAGFPTWTVLLIGVALGFALGGFTERVIIRPAENGPPLTVVVVTLGLFLLINSVATWIWAQGELPKVFPTPFGFDSVDLGVARVSMHSIGITIVALAIMGALYLLFNHTKIGLAMRATAQDPHAARLMGINVGRMLTLGWALAAAVGALAGMLVAPITFLYPGFMLAVLLYAFAAAVLGGLDSPVGAVVGGFVVGVAENLFGTYTPGDILGPEMKLPLTLLLLVIVLLIKPSGLFGRQQVRRV
jgi:branched-chain amino acid transport system permease protein